MLNQDRDFLDHTDKNDHQRHGWNLSGHEETDPKRTEEALFASPMAKDQLNHILLELAASEPFTGLGFMNMDPSLVTSMLSTTLTHCIDISLVCVQSEFKQVKHLNIGITFYCLTNGEGPTESHS